MILHYLDLGASLPYWTDQLETDPCCHWTVDTPTRRQSHLLSQINVQLATMVCRYPIDAIQFDTMPTLCWCLIYAQCRSYKFILCYVTFAVVQSHGTQCNYYY